MPPLAHHVVKEAMHDLADRIWTAPPLAPHVVKEAPPLPEFDEATIGPETKNHKRRGHTRVPRTIHAMRQINQNNMHGVHVPCNFTW